MLGRLSDLIAGRLLIFRQLRKTVVIVTHDLHEAAYFADQIVLLRDGRVLQRGTMTDLVTAPSDPFVSEFVSAQQFNAAGELN